MPGYKTQLVMVVHPDTAVTGEMSLLLQHVGFRIVGIGERQVVAQGPGRHPDVLILGEGDRPSGGYDFGLYAEEVLGVPVAAIGGDQGLAQVADTPGMGGTSFLPSRLNSAELLVRVRSFLRRTNGDSEEPDSEEFA